MRDSLIGLAGIAAFVGLVVLACAQYAQVFVRSVPITVQSERAGLLLDPGAPVKLNGVIVGRVTAVRTEGNGATIGIGLDPATVADIPSDVFARIVPPTLFGAKYVDLVVGPAPSVQPIAAGAVIDRSRVSVEINATFEHTVQTLDAAPAVKLNAALSAVAGTVDGHGAQLGHVLVDLNTYLRQFNPSLPALTGDLPPAAATSNLLADAAPDLVHALDNAGALSDTLVDQRDALAATLRDTTDFADYTTEFLRRNADGLDRSLHLFAPVTALLARYSPAVPCVLGGLTHNAAVLRPIIGGSTWGGTARNAHVLFTLDTGREAYHYPTDLPTVAETSGPSCYGLPVVHRTVPYQRFDTGVPPYAQRRDSVGLGQLPIGLDVLGQLVPNRAAGPR